MYFVYKLFIYLASAYFRFKKNRIYCLYISDCAPPPLQSMLFIFQEESLSYSQIKMAARIDAPANSDTQRLMCFLQKEGRSVAEIPSKMN